ncbi:MAG: PIN domain-containing protein [Sphingomonadaceae bacterium]
MTAKPRALIDTKVIVSALAPDHPDHGDAASLFDRCKDGDLAVPAHAVAEAYSVLTRANGLFRWAPGDCWLAIGSILKVTTLVGVTPAATIDAVRSYAHQGGIGPRLYDRLIGEAAIHNRIDTIITWNVRHMKALFPELQVQAPREWIVS